MRFRKLVPAALAAILIAAASGGYAQQRAKIRGYITAKPDEQSLQVLDDVILLSSGTRWALENSPPGKQLRPQDVEVGTLIEAEGTWAGRHRFTAQRITCDLGALEREVREHAYLEREPAEAMAAAVPGPVRLKVDGEILLMGEASAKRLFEPGAPGRTAQASAEPRLAGRLVRYTGLRQTDGAIAAREVELGPSAPADAFELPHGLKVVKAKDPKTGIDILEFRKQDKVEGRLKLFPVREVQQYLSRLGQKLISGQTPPPETSESRFRFFAVEDEEPNASALPDGTIFVNTGLLGIVENEAELAFVLSHEIAHVQQAHYWRHVHETRTQRVLLRIAAAAAYAYIGNLGIFLGQLGMAAVVNGHSRRLENQADRLALENIVEQGYDPRQAVRLLRTLVDRYRDRSTSVLWSNHDSALSRGSFLTVQTERRYPGQQFSAATGDAEAFLAMREAMGPVKIL